MAGTHRYSYWLGHGFASYAGLLGRRREARLPGGISVYLADTGKKMGSPERYVPSATDISASQRDLESRMRPLSCHGHSTQPGSRLPHLAYASRRVGNFLRSLSRSWTTAR